jgi:hypothetical protein
MAYVSRSLAAALLAAASAAGQVTLIPGYSVASVTSAATLGIPGPLGGLEFSADGGTLYVGGSANGPSGAVYSVPVIRNTSSQQVVGLGAGVFHAAAPDIDGGLAFGPAGTLFFTRFPANAVGQIAGATYASFPLSASTASVGGLEFVPQGFPNGGTLLVTSATNGDVFTVGLTSVGNGTFTPGAASFFASLAGGTDGLRTIPNGTQSGDILVTNSALGTIEMLHTDSTTGLPFGGATTPLVTPFATGIPGVEGIAFDPLTHDVFVTAGGAAGPASIIQIAGFPSPILSLAISTPSLSAQSGGSVTFDVQSGPPAASGLYAVAAGVSGSSPGIDLAFVHVALNPDAFTDLALGAVNTPLFDDFAGPLDSAGHATATLNAPPIPPVAIGVTITFAAVVFLPLTSSSNAVHLAITP